MRIWSLHQKNNTCARHVAFYQDFYIWAFVVDFRVILFIYLFLFIVFVLKIEEHAVVFCSLQNFTLHLHMADIRLSLSRDLSTTT